jgi:lysophospholipase L1-like esterase
MKVRIGILLVFFFLIAAQLVSARPVTLVTLGDSLTAGDGDDGIGGGYPPRLVARLQVPYPGSVLRQFGISGDTTTDLINKQLGPAVAALNAAPAANLKVAVVWIGSNDFFGFYNWTIHEAWCSGMGIDVCEDSELGMAADNVKTILSTLKAAGATIYVALLDDQSKRPVIADPVLRAATFPGITDEYAARMSTEIGVYNSRVQAHATTYGAHTVDFYHTTIFENWATLSDDGNHPNGAGYDVITTIWYNAIAGTPPPPPPPPPVVPEGINMAPVLHLLGDRPERTVLQEDFESWPLSGWTIVNNGGDCVWQSHPILPTWPNYAGSSGMAAAANSDFCGPGTTMNTDLLSPLLDLSMAEEATLTYVTSYNDYLFDADYAEVSISTDGGTSWASLLRWEEDHDRTGPGEVVTLDLTPYAGSIMTRLRFRYYAPDWDFWWMIDQVRVTRK